MGDAFYSSHDTGPEWATPEYIWRPLADALGGFDLDPASGCETKPIARVRYQLPENDGLKDPWFGHVWVNPPYGRRFNDAWARRIVQQAQRERVRSVTALLGASTSTDRWHEGEAPLSEADLFTFIDHRVGFEGEMEGNASFASVILTFGVESVTREYLEALDCLGLVLKSALAGADDGGED